AIHPCQRRAGRCRCHRGGDAAAALRLMPIVQITAGHSVKYSTTNGLRMTEFDDGEFYEVPAHVANGMVARGWARLANPPGGADTDKPAPPPGIGEPFPQPPQPQPAKPDKPDKDKEHEDDGKGPKHKRGRT